MEEEKQKTKALTKETVLEIVKFGAVGISNTLVDFGVLNLLMWSTKTYSGNMIILFNSISFTVAVINSYVWNKLWTFQNKEKEVTSQFLKFLAVSLVGLLINTGIVYFGTTYVEAFFGLSEGLWANVMKIMATGIALVWNFIGYKLWAFRENSEK